MRIDVDFSGYKLQYNMQKQSGDVNELNNRGENVKGRIIDVNQNMVLIQTSSGKQFSATTTVPMENFVNQEMDFIIMIGQDGEIILKPEIDEKSKNNLIDLKIEDMLGKLGKQISLENKELIKEMMKTSIPITKENFEEIKELKFAINLLKSQDFHIKLENGDESKNINELLKELQNRKDFGLLKQANSSVIDENLSLKDILLLKNLGIKSNLENIKSLYQLVKDININKEDLIGINKLLQDENFDKNLKLDIENVNKSIDLNFSHLDIKTNQKGSKTENLLMEIAENLSFEDMEKLNKGELLFEDFYKDSEIVKTKDINRQEILSEMKITKEDIMNILKNVEKALSKKIQSNSNDRKQDLSIDYKNIKEDIKSIINILGKESEVGKLLERQINPKLEIMNGMNERYNYNLIQFKINENYENTLQYYVKKRRKSIKKQEDVNIGLSLETKNHGNIKTMINYNKDKKLKLDFYTENKTTKNLFENNISSLEEVLKNLGFSSIDIKVVQSKDNKTNLIDDILYENEKLEIFEMWI